MRCLETVLGLTLLALGATAWSPSCKPCRCYLYVNDFRTAGCNNTALTSIPAFPRDTQSIWIHGGNNISSLQGGEFDGYTNLIYISIKYNPLIELPSEIFSKTINVIEINFENNKLKILQSRLFSNLLYLQKVWLKENQISILEDNCFLNVPRLNKIGLGGNRLNKINLRFIDDYSSLEGLHFSNNPVYCDDSICELMNRVVRRKMYWEERYMPRCAGPPSVRNKTWAAAVGILWGAGPERCPRRVDTEVQLLGAELNKTNNEVRRVLQEQEELRGAVNVLVRVQEATTALFRAEMEKSRREIRQTREAFKTELNKTNEEVRRVLQDAVDVLVTGQEATTALFKTEINQARGELQLVKEEMRGVKAELDVLLKKTEQALQGKNAVNILFEKVSHSRSGGQGVLLLRYSVLPGPNTGLSGPDNSTST